MRIFKDNAGRSWNVCINVDAIKRVRTLASVNLLEAAEGKLIEQLATDPVVLCDVLFALVKPDADAQHVSDADFGKAMGGDALDAGVTALLEELVDFFPQGKRRLLAKALQKLRVLEQRALTVAEQRLESPELEAKLEAALNASGD